MCIWQLFREKTVICLIAFTNRQKFRTETLFFHMTLGSPDSTPQKSAPAGNHSVTKTDEKEPTANELPDRVAIPEWHPDAPVPQSRREPGKRRLCDITRDKQRPLESQLQSLRRLGRKSTTEISSLLDLHPDDLEALAATAGKF